MKEILAGFTAEIFRPVVTLLIPGFWAITPWSVSMFLHFPASWRFAASHGNGSGLVFVIVATAAGLILENVGGRLENHLYRQYTDNNHTNWYAYLRLKAEDECIGLRYIKTYVLRMKFEAGMASAGVVTLIGVTCIPISWQMKLSISLFVIALTVYFVFEAKSSVIELADTRASVLARRGEHAEQPGNTA